MLFPRIRQWWRNRKAKPRYASGGLSGNGDARYRASRNSDSELSHAVGSSPFAPLWPYPGSACPPTDNTRRDDDRTLQVCTMSIREFDSFVGSSHSIPDTHCHAPSGHDSGSYDSGSSDSGGCSGGD